MPGIDFDQYKQVNVWKIIPTDRYIFHIDSSYSDDQELMAVIRDADNRHAQIANVLGIPTDNKAKEKYLKLNYWIHGTQVAVDSGLTGNGQPRFYGTGSASLSGIDYVIYDCSWIDHVRHLLHEETHLIWMREVGEAPALLNEGVAVYVESLLCDGYEGMKERFCKTWLDAMSDQKGLLRRLMDNQYFWTVYGKVPIYTLGGMLVLYMVDRWGIGLLRDVFAYSHYEDAQLAERIEERIGFTIDELESHVTSWAGSRLYGSSENGGPRVSSND